MAARMCPLCLLFWFGLTFSFGNGSIPIVINTWGFTNATARAWSTLVDGGASLDAVEKGCGECEIQQCDGTVGYGGSPDEIGETTLDAMIMDGTTHDVGAVGDLRRVKSGIAVARAVMQFTDHTLMVGESATKFAVEMGFKEEDLHTNKSIAEWENWKSKNCQPNYRENVVPNPRESCGPYKPQEESLKQQHTVDANMNEHNHDTIGMVVIDAAGRIASGTSTNGKRYKVPGRVGDSPIMGAGSYVDQDIGGAAATGDGDIMMRFLPSFMAVTMMGMGYTPKEAAVIAVKQIQKYYPKFSGAILVINMKGEYGASCSGFDKFPFSTMNSTSIVPVINYAKCIF